MSIKILGTLKGVGLKSKVDDKGDSIHMLDFRVELVEGADKIQDIVTMLKSILEINLDSKQPTLISSKPYKEDEEE
jgi:hypothetical protein